MTDSHSRQARIPTNAFLVELQTRSTDQNPHGLLGNEALLSLFEEARIRADAAWTTTASMVGSRVIRAMSVELFHPVKSHRPVSITVWVGKLGNSSFSLRHLLAQGDTVCAFQETVMVMVSADKKKSTPIPEDLRPLLEAFREN